MTVASEALRVVECIEDVVRKLVVANRILYARGVVDGFGHVSVRHPENEAAFLLSRSRAPALVVADDISAYDFDGRSLGPVTGAPYLERFIHGAIYRARPDIRSVVHSHSSGSILFGITGQRLRPVFHMAGFLGSGSTLFDIREKSGDSDLLIRSPELGRQLALALGQSACVLMRGHGSTVVGTSIEHAVYCAIYTEVNAKLQTAALQLGQITYLTTREAELSADTNNVQIGRAWALWEHELLQDS